MSDQAPYGYFPGTRVPRKCPAADEFNGKGVCRYCGQTGLVWEKHDRWVLTDIGGKRHTCPKNAGNPY